MDTECKPIPLRCLLMTLSMGVLLILLCAGPACTHKNRGSKFQAASHESLSFEDHSVPTPPYPYDASVKQPTQMVPMWQRLPLTLKQSWLLLKENSGRELSVKERVHDDHHRPPRPGYTGAAPPSKHHNHPQSILLREKRISKLLQILSDLLKIQTEKHNPGHKQKITVHAAFTCMTNQDVSLEPGTQVEIQLYQERELGGSLNRGLGFNLTSGRYTAPISGIYTFGAQLKITTTHQQVGLQGQETMKNIRGYIRLQLCIQSLCQDNLSLQRVSNPGGAGGPHTLSLSGVLYLQAGQYVSLYLENRMESWLVVERGSDFSGVLLGL
uniref:Erythroferrone n=1 Tax=Leptobrachium leishanense TaxID=445787 RepID=A0A8C5M304_9ANUR